MKALPRPARLALGGASLAILVVACSTAPTPPPVTRPPVALATVAVTGVGNVARSGDSATDLVLQFTEVGNATITAGAGSLQVTLTDQAGLPGTITFIGSPAVLAPGSLGATAALTAPSVLTVSIVDSDTLNIEQMTITGLGIRAGSGAALGPINAVIGGCAGSLVGCTAANVLTSPGSVVAPT